MKTIIIIKVSISIFLFYSCQKNNSIEYGYQKNYQSGIVNVPVWANEIMDIDSVMINDKLSVIGNIPEIKQHFGKPLQLIKGSKSEYLSNLVSDSLSSPEIIMVYEKITFVACGSNAILETIHLSDDLYINTPRIKLEKGLNIRKISEIYPESCKLISSSGNAWSGHIELRVSKKFQFEHLRWFLIFKNESLVAIELHRFF